MRWISAVLVAVFALSVAAPGHSQQRRGGELAGLPAYVTKGQQPTRLDGKVARALGLSEDGRPIDLPAVTTAYLSGARILFLVQPGNRLLFVQRAQNDRGQYYLTDTTGRLQRALDWTPVMANPADHPAPQPGFTEIKRFWLGQLGKPVR